MEELVYEPEYTWEHYVGMGVWIFCSVAAVAMLALTTSNHLRGFPPASYTVYAVCAAVALGFSIIPTWTIRRIRFGSEIVVERYLYSKSYPYEEVTHVVPAAIVTESGTIWLSNIKEESYEDLRATIEEAVSRGRMSEEQLTDEMMLAKVVMRSVSWIFAIALGIGGAALLKETGWLTYVEEWVGRGGSPFWTAVIVLTAGFYWPLSRMAGNL